MSEADSYSYGERLKTIRIDGELTKMYDTGDEESALSSITESQTKLTFWGKKKKYPSKKHVRSKRNHNDDDDDDDASGSSGSYAMVNPSGGFWVGPMNALGLLSSSKSSLPKTVHGETTPDSIVQDLTRSELELNRVEQNLEGYESTYYREEQRRQEQQQLQEQELEQAYKMNVTADTEALEEDIHSGEALVNKATKQRKRERLLFLIVGILLFLGMCALFGVGGYIWWGNKQQANNIMIEEP